MYVRHYLWPCKVGERIWLAWCLRGNLVLLTININKPADYKLVVTIIFSLILHSYYFHWNEIYCNILMPTWNYRGGLFVRFWLFAFKFEKSHLLCQKSLVITSGNITKTNFIPVSFISRLWPLVVNAWAMNVPMQPRAKCSSFRFPGLGRGKI